MKSRTIFTLTILLSLVVFMSAFMPIKQERIYKNLKVLPKDISKEDLGTVMDGFKTSLGVKCNYCHAPSETEKGKLDFASDAKPEKGTARMMMLMTAKINKKYFHIKDVKNPNAILPVSCITCHNGNERPKTLDPATL
ncbi:c-type cytochrome [Pedobacter quisquiliarum]|jgi:hypothetical protein|nr:c-type cytochrome [Pedobacter quisquiliarum]